jgi:uncharacterized repeat protein (TIGR01451 family)
MRRIPSRTSLANTGRRIMTTQKLLLFTLIGVILLGGVAPFVATISVDAQETSPTVEQSAETADASPQAKPRINLQSGRDVSTRFTGSANLTYALQSGQAQPLAMVSEDFDADGAADLAVGYASSAGSGLTLYKGNIEATAPSSRANIDAIAAGRSAQPFLPSARVFDLPQAPNFIAKGDFNGDGRIDVLTAARGGNALYLLANDGRGGFKAAQQFDLAGQVTALLAAEVNRPDGFMDVSVGIVSGAGPALVVYQGKADGLSTEGTFYPMPSEVTAIAAGQLDASSPADLAVAAGSMVVIVHGQDQRQNGESVIAALGPMAQMGRINIGYNIRGLALGNFILDREQRTEMAVVSDDGTAHVLKRGDLDMRPFTKEELKARRQVSDNVPGSQQWWTPQQPGDTQRWDMAGDIAGASSPSLSVAPQSLLIASRISGSGGDDLVTVDAANNKLRFISQSKSSSEQSLSQSMAGATSDAVDVAGAPIAALPMRLNTGPLGLVVLKEGQVAPFTIPSVIAATFIVTRSDDPAPNGCAAGDCSLREAIIDANNAAGADTITFAASTNGVPITLTIVGADSTAAAGDLDIRESLTITGNGSANTIIQAGTTKSTDGVNGNGVDRVFDVNPGPNGILTTNFSGVTIRHGKITNSDGGGIRFDGFFNNATDGVINITNCVLTDNYSNGRGGAFKGLDGTLNITGSTVSNNITKDGRGGGIDHRGAEKMDMTSSSVTGNSSNDVMGASGLGGGIFLLTGDGIPNPWSGANLPPISLIKSSNISNNTAEFDGGGINILGSPVSITSPTTTTTINNNVAGGNGGGVWHDLDNASGTGAGSFADSSMNGVTIKGNSAVDGGGLLQSRDTLTLTNCTIGGTAAGEPNTASQNGGGIANYLDGGSPSQIGELILNNCSIVGNVANNNGGGIFNDDFAQSGTANAKVTVTGGNITSNKAKNHGGGLANILNTGATSVLAILNGVTIKGNQANSDATGGGDGGGIYNSGGTVTIGSSTAVTIGGTAAGEPNTAVNGGGIFNSSGTLTMNGGSLNGNSATGSGGGIATPVSTTFTGVSVTNNTASSTGGGFNITGGTFGINGSTTITGNTATGNGGGIFNNGGTVTLPNSATIGGAGALRNMAANGGGIFNQAGSVTMTGGSLTGNTASSNGGGANVAGGTLTFASGVSITNNTTTGSGNGGGVAGTGGTININGGGVIQGNTAAGNGGGIHNNGSTILLPNATTIGGAGALRNMAANGGGIASVTGSLTMTGGTITGNQSSSNGAGVHHAGGTTNISNATITGNAATGQGGAFFNNGAGLTANLNRIISNTATGGGTGIYNQSGTPNLENNWWGCDGFPNTGGCQTAAGPAVASADTDPRVDLVLTATPSTINPNGTSTLKADVSKNSAGTTINPVVMNGLPVTFASDSLGSIAPTTVNLAALMATTTYTAGPNAGLSTVTAQVDNPPAASTQITIQANADLAVTKTDTPDQVLRNNNITYTINFVNNGPTNDPNVTVTDAVPTNTTFVSATINTGTGWTITSMPAVGGTGNVVFSNPDVPNGATATFTIVVKVDAAAPIGATITNNATAAGFPVDPTPGNNTGTATSTVIALADLAVTKTDMPDPVSSGANITYTVNFVNNGPDPASTVTVTDAVPANTTFVSAVVTTGTGWTVTNPPVGGTGNIVFSKGTVAAGETAVFTIVVKVTSSVAAGTTITNTATAASTTMDPDNSNNSSTATTLTQTRADLAVTKTDTPDPVVAGNNLTYTINFVNNGPSDAQTVTVTDAVPANTTFVSAVVTTGTGWTKTEPPVGGTGNIVFSKATVVAGETAVFTVVVKVNASAPDGATITNNAVAATATTDPTSGNDTGTATTTVSRQTDLAVTKTDTPDPVIAGQNITYTINFTSNGPSDADTVTVTDAVPANTTFVSAVVTTGTGWTVTNPPVGGTGNVVFSKGTVVNGETATFTVVVKVDTSAADGSTITNNAVAASASTDPTPGNNTGTATTTVNRQADLAVTKTDSPDPVDAGQNLTYTINFVNNGPSDASTVTVTDAVPANTTFVSAMVTTGTGWTVTNPAVGGTGNVVFSKATVTAGETAVFTIVVNVNSTAADGSTITNSATAATTTTDPDNSNNTATATTTVVNQADLEVTKSDAPDPVLAGANITYTINFKNNGPGSGNNVTVTDAVPANTTFVSASVTTGTGWTVTNPPVGGTGNVVFSKASVPNQETAVFTIVVKVNSNTAAGATITNSATVATTTTDTNSANNTGTTTTTVATQADIAVTKTDAPDPVVAGQNITYTVTITNNGPSDAQSVSLTDSVPANTTFVSTAQNTGPAFTCTNPPAGGTGNVSCTITTLAAGASASFDIIVKVNASVAAGSIITNSATGATTTTDPDNSNNTATATTTVATQADLAVTKSESPDPVVAGQNITYAINFTNNGTSDAQTVTVTDAVPANTTFVSAVVTTGTGWTKTEPPVGGTGNVVFSKGTVAAGETAVFEIVVKVNANTAAGATITNSATAASATTDPNNANNTGTATTTVAAQADLAVTKSDSPDPVVAGSNITYTINFTNNGPSDAQTVTVTDAVPANTTFVSASVTSGTGWTVTNPPVGGTGNVVFSKATVAAGETAVFQIVVNVNASTANNATITNSATAASTTTDPDNGNNTATATTTVINQADLSVTKSDSPDPVVAGQNITYTINFTNSGPGGANNVTVTDAVPANTTFVSASVTTGTGWTVTNPPVGGTGNVVFSKGSVANGETAVFQIVVNVNSNTAAGATITNSATAATTTIDPDNSNNTGTATTTVATQADIAVTKTDTPDPVVAGQNITYTVTITNNGPSDAQTVSLTDAVPANTTFVSTAQNTGPAFACTNPPAGGTGNVSCTITTLAAGASASFDIIVKVNANVANGTTITNSATGASSTTDPNNSNNTATATTTVATQADLAVTKSDAPDPVVAGQNITYTINFTNNGTSDAQSVTVTDAVPANTTFVSAVVTTGTGWTVTNPPVGGTGNVVFSKGTVAAGETAVFTVVVKVNANAASGSTITNSAVAASTTTDPNSGNNTGTATTTVATQADLAVTKSDSPDPVVAGGNITYTINFVNNGTSDAQSVTVTDAVPANTTFVSAAVTTGTGWTVTNPPVGGTGNVVFSKGTVAAGETAVFTIVVNVNDNTPNNATITNSATAASTTTDPDNGNNTATATTTVINQADLSVTKSDSPDPVVAGQNITYTINFTNSGPGGANNVTVTDAVPANTTFVSASVTTGTGWTVTNPPVGGTGNVVFSKSPVANGETAVFQIVVNVNSNTAAGATITNSATAATTTIDPDNSNNTGTATTTVATQADIAVTKTDTPDPVVAGQNITYTVTITNNGPSDAQNVSLTDSVPANTTFVSAAQNTGPAFMLTTPPVGGTGNVSATIATLAAGASASFEIVVHVNANVANGTTITNSATGASSTTDPNSGNNTGTATTTVNTQADLSATKSDAPDPVIAGQNITYTINFANNGSSDAQSVTVTDANPVNTTFVSASVTTGTGWTVTNPPVGGTGNVVFSKGTVANGETATFEVVVKVNANVADGATITNSATAASTTTDPSNGNNTATTTTTVNTQANLSVTKTDSPDPVTAGNNLTYTITLTNNGPSDAQNLQLTDNVPTDTTFVSFTAPTGWTSTTPPVGGTGTITSTIGTLAAGASAEFTLVVNVNASTPHLTVVTNSATATSTTTDPDSGNNTGTTTTTVNARPDLSVTKSDLADPVMIGQQISYHIEVKNNGPSNATGVVLTDRMASSSTFVSANPSVGSCAPPVNGKVICQLGDMLNGATVTVDIVVKSKGNPNTIFDTASVVANEADPDMSNNEASESTRLVGFRHFSFTPPVVTGGCQNSVGTLLFTSPAPAGVLIHFGKNLAAVDPIPDVTTVGGETSIPVTAVTHVVNADSVANITAHTTSGPNSIMARVKLTPVRLTGMTFDQNPVMSGTDVMATITLSCPLPNPITVRLTTNKGAAKPEMSQIEIAAGETSAMFKIKTNGPPNMTVTATITAIAPNGGFVRGELTVTPKP